MWAIPLTSNRRFGPSRCPMPRMPSSSTSMPRRKLSRFPDALRRVDFQTLNWSKAGEGVREFAERNQAAVEVWHAGTELPDAVYHQPGTLAADTLLPVVQDLRTLAYLAALEGSRLQEAGDMKGAWSWYKAILRSSRHVGRHGVLVERLTGAALHKIAAHRISAWAAEPRVDQLLLRRALEETMAADAMTWPLSENLKLEYLMCMRDLRELRVMLGDIPVPGGKSGWLDRSLATKTKNEFQRFRVYATNDVERSRRVVRLLFANWLPQMDKLPEDRAPIAIQYPTLIYAADPAAPPAARAVSPEILDKAVGQTLYAKQFFRPTDYGFRGVRRNQARLGREPDCSRRDSPPRHAHPQAGRRAVPARARRRARERRRPPGQLSRGITRGDQARRPDPHWHRLIAEGRAKGPAQSDRAYSSRGSPSQSAGQLRSLERNRAHRRRPGPHPRRCPKSSRPIMQSPPGSTEIASGCAGDLGVNLVTAIFRSFRIVVVCALSCRSLQQSGGG